MIKHDINDFFCQVQENAHEYQPHILKRNMYVNAYECGRAYGGPEEGGWWYDYEEPLESINVRTKVQAVKAYELLAEIYDWSYDGHINVSSVIHDGDLRIKLEDTKAQYYPERRPHYE